MDKKEIHWRLLEKPSRDDPNWPVILPYSPTHFGEHHIFP
jgi:hypothetical protein